MTRFLMRCDKYDNINTENICGFILWDGAMIVVDSSTSTSSRLYQVPVSTRRNLLAVRIYEFYIFYILYVLSFKYKVPPPTPESVFHKLKKIM